MPNLDNRNTRFMDAMQADTAGLHRTHRAAPGEETDKNAYASLASKSRPEYLVNVVITEPLPAFHPCQAVAWHPAVSNPTVLWNTPPPFSDRKTKPLLMLVKGLTASRKPNVVMFDIRQYLHAHLAPCGEIWRECREGTTLRFANDNSHLD